MTKVNGKNKKAPVKKLEQLANFKYKYDLLTNELFHLKEFMSLIEFDPSYCNDNENYRRFLQDEDLTLESIQPPQNTSNDYSLEENPKRSKMDGPVRRRQLRGSTSTAQVENSLWANVEVRVREKYDDLSRLLKSNDMSEMIAIDKANQEVIGQSKVPKLAQKRTKKRDEHHDVNGHNPATKKQNTVKIEGNSHTETTIPSNSFTIEESGSESDHFYFTTSSEDEAQESTRSRRKRPRITLEVHPPRQTVTNPLHVNKSRFKNLHEFLSSFKYMEEDMTIEEYEKYIKEQAEILAAIRKGLERGALKYDPGTDSVVPITTKEARIIQSNKPDPISYFYKEQNLQTFQDYLLNHGVYMSKLFQNTKRARIARARKVSIMIEQHFRHIAGAEERKVKDEEKRKRALARAAMQAVKKRWTVAEKAYRVLRKDKEEQIKKIKGKEHLSKMLEQSTQLLGAQLNRNNKETDSVSEHNDSEEVLSDSDDESLTSTSEEDLDVNGIEEDVEMDELIDQKVIRKETNLSFQSALRSPELNTKVSVSSEMPESDLGSVTTEDSLSEEETYSEASNEDGPAEQNVGLASLFDKNDDEKNDDENEIDYVQSSDQLDENNPNSESDESDEKDESGEDDESAKQQEQNNNGDGFDLKKNQESGETENKVIEKAPVSDPLSVIDVPVPQLLRGTLRTYQKQGLNWMASLYNNNTNGIMADEMGLGKTIQTISLLCYLACEKENWGPHLIIVPTSVLLNWEMELKRFAPGFKVMTYYGSPQQRKEKRKGWNKPDTFHICIVSYQLVVQDQNSFKRKKWKYMILDEAHNIKNFRSTRWQALLNFNSERRLLLTGTPLQNNIAELWSLLYFLMPQTITDGKQFSGFADLEAFQQWFGRPVDKVIETGENQEYDAETKKTVNKLHQVLRPYLLRRLKADVEKQMPGKYEHVVYCRLSKRQRFLYDDFMSRSQTKATLASGNFMSIINCLMQLRKVCNHPDLFEVRPISTSFCMEKSVAHDYTSMNTFVHKLLHCKDLESNVNLDSLNFIFTNNDLTSTLHHSQSISKLKCINEFVEQVNLSRQQDNAEALESTASSDYANAYDFFNSLGEQTLQQKINKLESMQNINKMRCERRPMYGQNVIKLLQIANPDEAKLYHSECLQNHLQTYADIIECFAVITPAAVSLSIRDLTIGLNDESLIDKNKKNSLVTDFFEMNNPLHHLQTKMTIAFPDKSLLQYDCGKLQKLATLLQQLKDNGHRALLFTQMTKVLDILEQFLNYHGYLYMRLDGATKIEDRQILTERFNSDPRITIFILSSRSGGLGINLTGADTVIFYDSDWNPAMDKQCQDRCHRIGQTRDVHIYRFVSEHTIESNILKKANQKRHLDNVVIQKGDFTTDYFTKLSVKDLLGNEVPDGIKNDINDKPLLQQDSDANNDPKKLEKLLAQAEDEDDVKAANLAMQEVEVDNDDFDEHKVPTLHGESTGTDLAKERIEDEYEGTNHVEEYMLRFIANGYYY